MDWSYLRSPAEAKKRAMFAGDEEAGDDVRKRNVSNARGCNIYMQLCLMVLYNRTW